MSRIIKNSSLDFNYTLKRLIPLFLAFLALFTTVQQPTCACGNTKPVVHSVVSERDCCQVAAQPVASSVVNERSCCRMIQPGKLASKTICGVHRSKPCCGMVDRSSPAVANSIRISANPRHLVIQLRSFTHSDLLQWANCQPLVAGINRAPPYLDGFGSSDTYLFKRTLLL